MVTNQSQVKESIMSAEYIERTIKRISHEIVEAIGADIGRLVLVGIKTRGVPLAHRLAIKIQGIVGVLPNVVDMDVAPWRDDLESDNDKTSSNNCLGDLNLDNKSVVVVDDVLYTGRSVKAAFLAMSTLGRPKIVYLAVLVDRGHRELPFKANFVGKNIATNQGDKVKVSFVEVDGVDSVVVV